MYRRDFLKAASTAAIVLALPADATMAAQSDQKGNPTKLTIAKRTIDVNGKAAEVFGLLRPDGGHGVVIDAESQFDVELTNMIGEPTLVHWHGLTPPWNQDGVPGNPAALIDPARTRRYAFPAGTGGTHWMHAHTLQEQRLLAAPLIVRTAADRAADEQEVVVLLHDFSFKSPEELLSKLRGPSDAMAHDMDGMATMDHDKMGHMAADDSMDMSGMSMSGMQSMPGMAGMDLNDIEYDAYLANDRTLGDPELVKVERSGIVRLRIINGATATAFTIDLGSLRGEVVAVDGQPVPAIAGRFFPMTMGQRLDIRVRIPREGGTFPVLALREGARQRAGLVLSTPNAQVAKVSVDGTEGGPVLDLGFERRLVAASPLAARPAARHYDLTLAGEMKSYTWTILGSGELSVAENDRVEVTMSNKSVMSHPMHLHGHHFQVVAINGEAFAGAVRDTVLVPPMQQVTIAFDAANRGRWPLHCHHLYHMATGMMTFVNYGKLG